MSDGDTNTIKAIDKADPYPGLKVEKHECINHVSKRFGTALKNLVDKKKQQGVTLGGRGVGRLMQPKMTQLQKYYGKAIRSSGTVEEMRRAIWAGFKHSTSTDDPSCHDDCPKSTTFWCFYQKAIAKGNIPKKLSHSSTYLNPTVA